MQLTRLKLVDVGVYKGPNEFDFRVEPKKPIILYGGANGSGKTTLFESIPLCLYGQNFGEEKISKKQYHEKIYRLFHRYTETHTSAQHASVTLEFQHNHGGNIYRYKVTRSWQNNEGKIEESLAMSRKIKAGEKYKMIKNNEPEIQDLINQMIPKDIATLFFFDGEKIQNIARTGNENIHIKSSFDSMLGLDLPSQLHDDIGLYMMRNSDDEANALLAELDCKTKEKGDLEKRIGQGREKIVFLKSEINSRHRELELKEEKFFKMGGRFAQERQRLLNEKMGHEKKIQYTESAIHDIVGKNLPLDIVPEQLKEIKVELDSDITRIKESFQKDMLGSAFVDLIKTFKPMLNQYDEKTKNDIVGKVQNAMDAKIESLSDKQKTTFDFSLSEISIMSDEIESILTDPNPIKSYHKAHMHDKEKIREINAKLDVAPKQDEVGPLYSEIKAVTLEIGEMEQELQTLEKLEAQDKSLLVLLNSKIRKCLTKKKSDKRKLRGLEMAPKIQDALDDYANRLRTRKIKLLESNILEGIKKCFHKRNLIAKISIEPDTYKVTLYRENGDEIAKEQLSKGELQVYATAIVWGLARTSGRALPFIMDTPFARLDKEHRENLIENFYPSASHQSIIFSTNTEIIRQYHDILKPYSSRIQLIEYDAKKDGSLVGDGYFDGGNRLEVR